MDREKIYEEIPRSCFEPPRPCPKTQNPESVLDFHMPDFGSVIEEIRRQTIENSKINFKPVTEEIRRQTTENSEIKNKKYESWRKQVLSVSLP